MAFALLITCMKMDSHFFSFIKIFPFSDGHSTKMIYLPDANPAAIWFAMSLKFAFLEASSRAETQVQIYLNNDNIFYQICNFA